MINSRRFVVVGALVFALASFGLPAGASPSAEQSVSLPSDSMLDGQLDLSCHVQENWRVDPTLSASYLSTSGAKAAKVETVIGRFSLEGGLFAGFTASNGKRFLIRSWVRSDGTQMAEVAHYNEKTGKAELLLGRSRVGTNDGEFRFGNYQVVGIDLIPAMREIQAARKTKSSATHAGLRNFMLTPEGKGLSEAIPALYVALEGYLDNERLKHLQAPLGGLLGALQLVSGAYNPLENGEEIFGGRKVKELRGNCVDGDCKFKGRDFKLLAPGIFDSISYARSSKAKEGSCKPLAKGGPFGRSTGSIGPFGAMPRDAPPFATPSAGAFLPKNGDGNCTEPGGCFGMCGWGCVAPGEISTGECYAHDMCVCRYGHLSCVNNADIPPECTDCGSLWDAVGSFIEELFSDPSRPPNPEEMGDYEWWGDSPG